MLIYQDRVTGDEIASDALDCSPCEGYPCVLEIKSTRVAMGVDDVDIGCGDAYGGAGADEGVDDAVETGLNVVLNHGLQPISLTKAEYKSMTKNYWKTLKESMDVEIKRCEDDEYSRKIAKSALSSFKKNFAALKEFVKDVVLANFDEFEFYMGESNDPSAFIIPARYVGEAVTPNFYIFLDAVREEKA